jgi:hypothetical protein
VIGAGGASDSVFFGLPLDVVVDSEHRLHVLDAFAGQIHTFDRHGTLLRKMGTRGGGPGEFTNPRSMALMGGILLVADERIERFDTEGRVLPSLRSASESLVNRAERIFASPEILLLQTRGFDTGRRRTRIDTLVLNSLDPETGLDTDVLRVPYTSYQQTRGRTGPAAMGVTPSLAALGNELVAVTVGDSFHIRVYNLTGVAVRDVHLSVPRIRTTREDYNNWRARLPDPPTRGLPRAEYRPAIGEMVGSSGMLLVRRRDVTPHTDPHTVAESEWVLLDADGIPAERYRFPRDFRPRTLGVCWITGIGSQRDMPVILQYPARRHAPAGCAS